MNWEGVSLCVFLCVCVCLCVCIYAPMLMLLKDIFKSYLDTLLLNHETIILVALRSNPIDLYAVVVAVTYLSF